MMSSVETVPLDISVQLVQDQNMKIPVLKEHTMLLLVIRVQLKMMPVHHVKKDISVKVDTEVRAKSESGDGEARTQGAAAEPSSQPGSEWQDVADVWG